MESLDLRVLGDALAWRRAGHAVTLVTVVETWGSAPRPPGALLAVRDDGVVSGSVSGGCVEDDLIARVKAGERNAAPSMIAYGVSKDEAARFGLPCGGTLRLVQEPLREAGWVQELLERTASARTGRAHADAGQRPGHARGRVARREHAFRRPRAHHLVRPEVAAAAGGRRPAVAGGGADGADAGFRSAGVRSARRVLEHARRHRRKACARHARRRGARNAARCAQRRRRAHARPQARRHGADGGAALRCLLCRRAGLVAQPGGAQAAAGRALRPHR